MNSYNICIRGRFVKAEVVAEYDFGCLLCRYQLDGHSYWLVVSNANLWVASYLRPDGVWTDGTSVVRCSYLTREDAELALARAELERAAANA